MATVRYLFHKGLERRLNGKLKTAGKRVKHKVYFDVSLRAEAGSIPRSGVKTGNRKVNL